MFGIPGVHNLPIYDAIHDETRIHHILARHEQGAAFMADGYARATGEIGVVITTSGPGALNAMTALGTAYADYSPVLCVSSQIESIYVHNGAAPFRGILHEMKDQLGAMSTVSGWARRATSVQEIPGLMHSALMHLSGHRPTPAYLEVPYDVLCSTTAYPAIIYPSHSRSSVDSSLVVPVVDALQKAERPLIIAGDAVVRASEQVVKLAEALDSPVLTDTAGKGVLPETHPLALGRAWRSGIEPLQQMIEESDVILVLGCTLRSDETGSWTMPLRGRVFQVDPDADQLGLNYRIELGIAANPCAVAEELLRLVQHAGGKGEGAQRARKGRKAVRENMQERRGPQAAYLDAIQGALPGEAILCCDMTMTAYAAQTYYLASGPRRFMAPSGFGTLGFALPAAIGAKAGKPDAPVVCICGEGGLLFTLQEMATATQFNLPVCAVVFNDHTFTAVKQAQRREYNGRYIGVDLRDPDIGMLAKAFGFEYRCVDTPEGLGEALAGSVSTESATLVEVKLEQAW